jgi:hypothetical protein
MHLPEREADIVATIYEGLTLLGYVVFRTGQWRADRAGNDVGCPDLFVTRPGWDTFKALEVKTQRGRLSPHQQWLHDLGVITVVRCWEDALRAVQEETG